MKPKQSYAHTSGAKYDQCGTPPHGLAPLLPYLPPHARIWEPAAGAGMLANALEAAGHLVIRSDWIDGQDFFSYAPDPASYDMIVTNPPYSIKYRWMERCYQLGKPWALLVPLETVGAASALKQYRQHGWEELRLMQRINFSMPDSGFCNSGAQFPVIWLCWHLLPTPVLVADVPQPAPEHRLIRPKKRKQTTQMQLYLFEQERMAA